MKTSGFPTRAFLWVPAAVLCLVLYYPGLTAWFQRDDFAWLNMASRASTGNDLWRALFQPAAQGTIRPLSERAFFISFFAMFGANALPFHLWAFVTQLANLFLLSRIAQRLTGSAAAAISAPVLWVGNHSLAG